MKYALGFLRGLYFDAHIDLRPEKSFHQHFGNNLPYQK